MASQASGGGLRGLKGGFEGGLKVASRRGLRFLRPQESLRKLQITMAGTHTRESAPEGVNRGKRYSRAFYRVQITMAGTHARDGA